MKDAGKKILMATQIDKFRISSDGLLWCAIGVNVNYGSLEEAAAAKSFPYSIIEQICQQQNHRPPFESRPAVY